MGIQIEECEVEVVGVGKTRLTKELLIAKVRQHLLAFWQGNAASTIGTRQPFLVQVGNVALRVKVVEREVAGE